MSKKTIALVLIIVGAVLFVFALLAGIFGFPHHGFGYTKIIGVAVGAVIAAAGIILLVSKKKPEAKEPAATPAATPVAAATPATPEAPAAPEAPKAPEEK